MAPPLRRGRALLLQRLGGLVFLLVLAGLLGLSVAMYQKAFSDTVAVTLMADRAGNQLTKGADVKARGVIVGEVAEVRPSEQGARLELELEPEAAARVPADARAMLLPKTLFGEKFVALTFDGAAREGGTGTLADGGVIEQDRSQTAREFGEALDALLPLLQTLEPEQVSLTLNAVSSALRDRGDRIGDNLVLARDYLAEFNPELPRLAANLAGTADFADTLDAATPDVLALLEDLSAVNRNLVRDSEALDRVLRDTAGVAGTLEQFVAENEQRFITLARESVPNLRLYEEFSPGYPCLLDGIHRADALGEVFGGLQPGLHITLEFTQDNGPYVPGDEPEYLETAGPTCYGLEGEPIRPFPAYRNPQDGHRDDQRVDPRTGEGDGPPPTGPGGPQTYPDQRRGSTQVQGSATPFSPASYDRAALGAALAPELGVLADDVPDVAVLLLAPMARGTVVQLA